MEIQLKKFDMTQISHDKTIVLIGKRDTGKSFLVKDILYHQKNIPAGSVISGTEAANEFYSSMVPPIFIHEEYQPIIISNLLKRQKQLLIQRKENQSLDPRAFLILDDCLYDNSWVKSTDVRSLFMNGRHYHILFILTMQYALGIPPNLRTNVDFIFILRENYVSNRKRLYDHYAGMFPSFEMFCQVMDQCTENYECLVVNNNAKSNQLVDQVFWYKAEAREDFKIGAKTFWDYSLKHYQKNKNQNIEDYNKKKDKFNVIKEL